MFLAAGIWLFYNEQEDERAGRDAKAALTQLIQEIETVEAGGTPAANAVSTADVSPVATAAVAADATATADAQIVAETATGDTAQADATADDMADDMPGYTIDGHTYIGYVTISEIGLALPVQKDYAFELLDTSPVRYLGSLAEGNMIVAGHNFNSHFSPLKNVSLGAQVTFTDVDGNVYYYIVSKIQTIGGNDYSGMLAGADQWDLTLFTCVTGGKSRLTLRCVETEKISAKTR
jgi:sortase A